MGILEKLADAVFGIAEKVNEKKDTYEEIYDPSKKFYGHPERKPAGCRACGGPFPMCVDSCKLFDD